MAVQDTIDEGVKAPSMSGLPDELRAPSQTESPVQAPSWEVLDPEQVMTEAERMLRQALGAGADTLLFNEDLPLLQGTNTSSYPAANSLIGASLDNMNAI